MRQRRRGPACEGHRTDRVTVGAVVGQCPMAMAAFVLTVAIGRALLLATSFRRDANVVLRP